MTRTTNSKADRQAAELTNSEAEALGRLLQGMTVPLRVATRLVHRKICVWEEPTVREAKHKAVKLVFTPDGLDFARTVWPDVAVSAETQPMMLDLSSLHVGEARQIPLDFTGPLSAEVPATEALSKIIDDEALARIVLRHFPSGRGLPIASRKTLQSLGLDLRQAELVTLAFALVRACRADARDGPDFIIDGPDAMARVVWETQHVDQLDAEYLWVVTLDGSHRIIGITTAAQGAPNLVHVELRDILTAVLRSRATACYIAHNHPSGTLEWSPHDLQLTQRVAQGMRALGVDFLDHIVLAPDGRYLCLRK